MGSLYPKAPAVSRGAIRWDAGGMPWDPEFEDVLDDAPVDALDPALPRSWAPFIVIGG